MKKSIDISIVIPVYNEQHRLPSNLDKIISYLKKSKLSYEIILIDDGSKDKTWNILEGYKKKHRHIVINKHLVNLGKGGAVKTGMFLAKGKLILMTDCDLSTPIEELPELFKHIKSHDIVIGSRRLSVKKLGRMPEGYRTFLGDIYYELLRIILLPSVKDTNCGFKLFSNKVVKPVFEKQRIHRWGYDAEILFIANKHGFSIKEVPVKWTHYAGSKVKIVDAVIKTLGELMTIKINNWKGLYD